MLRPNFGQPNNKALTCHFSACRECHHSAACCGLLVIWKADELLQAPMTQNGPEPPMLEWFEPGRPYTLVGRHVDPQSAATLSMAHNRSCPCGKEHGSCMASKLERCCLCMPHAEQKWTEEEAWALLLSSASRTMLEVMTGVSQLTSIYR